MSNEHQEHGAQRSIFAQIPHIGIVRYLLLRTTHYELSTTNSELPNYQLNQIYRDEKMKNKSIPNNQRGAIAVIFVILLFVLIGFTALGIDAGRWYLAREKLKEAADAAAMAGVQAYGFSASGNCDEWETLAEDTAKQNFDDTQGSGSAEYVDCQLQVIDVTYSSSSGTPRVNVRLCATCGTYFAGIFGIDTVEVCASQNRSVAERVPAEIMLVLDRSGSMGSSMSELRDAAKSFADHFECTEDVDRMGVISYATGVTVDFPLANYFVRDGIKGKIDDITIRVSVGDVDTNMEDAIDQADDNTDRLGNATTTFTKYPESTPQSERAKQFLIFFTDGQANSFRGPFTRDGITYDGVIPDPNVVSSWGEHREGVDVCGDEGDPHEVTNGGYLRNPYDGTNEVLDENGIKVKVDFLPTGDGEPISVTQCKWDCPGGNDTPYENTKWPMFDPLWNSEYGENEDDYSIDDYCDPSLCDVPHPGGLPPCCNSPYCNVPEWDLKNDYVLETAKKMTIYHARKLKEQGIIIYCIGLGNVNPILLKGIASKDEYYFKAPSASEMKRIFNQVAMEIKKYVYLVQ